MRILVGAIAALLLLSACSTGTTQSATSPSITTNSVTASPAESSSAAPDRASPPGSGVPEYTPPPADAQGVAACDPQDSWGTGDTAGVTAIAYTDAPTPVTVTVRRTSGDEASQSAETAGSGYPISHQFDFPEVDPSSVAEVILTDGTKRCWMTPDPETAAKYPLTQGGGR